MPVIKMLSDSNFIGNLPIFEILKTNSSKNIFKIHAGENTELTKSFNTVSRMIQKKEIEFIEVDGLLNVKISFSDCHEILKSGNKFVIKNEQVLILC
ncbi:hypothetical protein [Proteus mirabilis]|uniref:hypothetical protein n=1 Tax=Proteus mirabilis TaxID=584 RepID=UPI0034D65517